jgi:uncharacterized LabA/DUF88 family protein
MKTIVYIDGFNLYYRMLKARPHCKWLNLLQLASQLLDKSHKITRVNYYTARLSARAHDPEAPARQAIYLSALSSIPEIAIHEGNFMTSEVWMPLFKPPQAKPDDSLDVTIPDIFTLANPNNYTWIKPAPDVVKVVKFEEKGSDVNLGAHLVRDAFTNAFDVALVLTNDSDLVEPIRIATMEAGKKVGLLVPVKSPHQSLSAVASFYLHIRTGHLTRSQFPDHIILPNGHNLSKPASWV